MMAKAKTLCAFKKNYLKENLPKYKKLVRDARFVCKKCGRVADKKKWLHKAVALK
jgi:transposase-like protein